MTAFEFSLAALATWRLSALLVREGGPYHALTRLRAALGEGVAGRALRCFYCTSLWVAAPAAVWLVGLTPRWPVAWLAASGAACLLERLTTPREAVPALELDDAEALVGARPSGV